jgi:hypothetical protein
MHHETTLGTLPLDRQDERLAVVAVAAEGARPGIEVRVQTDCDELGWVTQRRLALSTSQARALAAMLADAARVETPAPVDRPLNNVIDLASFRAS